MSEDDIVVKISVSAALQDAGEATRSLEIVKGVRDYAPKGYAVDVVYFSHGGKFEKSVLDNGFKVFKSSPQLEGVGFYNDLKPSANNFVGSQELAAELLKGEKEAIEENDPDVMLHGFWPFSSLARRMTNPEIPGICFLPLPLEKNIYCRNLMKTVPDQMKMLSYCPKGLQKALMKILPVSAKLKAPILRQSNILKAAEMSGWNGPVLENLFDMMKSDITVVNDMPLYYKGIRLPENFYITGPLFAQSEGNAEPEAGIRQLFGRNNDGKIKIYCTMGSSGREDSLLEAVKAISSLPEEKFCAVILVPKAVCSLSKVRPYAQGKTNIYVTDSFVPAKLVNTLADITVCHGGQGTVQTAVYSGTPIIGVAMQPEQQINLDNIAQYGACIRIPQTRWKENSIKKAIIKIAHDPSYRGNAKMLSEAMRSSDGKGECARVIWDFILNRLK